MDEFFPNLLVGDMMAAEFKPLLKSAGITHIINLASVDGVINHFGSSFTYLKVKCFDSDDQPLLPIIEKCIPFIT